MNLNKIKTELLSRRAELQSRFERTHRHIYHKTEPVSAKFSEQVKQMEDDQLVMALESDAIEEIKQINKALQRMEDQLYENCASCGKPIGAARLGAIAYTEHCIRCTDQ